MDCCRVVGWLTVNMVGFVTYACCFDWACAVCAQAVVAPCIKGVGLTRGKGFQVVIGRWLCVHAWLLNASMWAWWAD